MQSLIQSKSAGVTGGRGTAGASPGRDLLYLHALWGLRAAGVVGGRPRGGWPATVARGVWCQALSFLRPPVPLCGQPGLRDPCVPGAVGAGVGTQPRPSSVPPLGPALLAVGVAEGQPRGGCPPPLRGASVVRRSPSPDCPPSGRAIGVRHPHAVRAGVWVWGPNDPPMKKTREHSAAKQLWPNRDATTRFPARAWRGRAHKWRAQRGCRWTRTALATPG